MHVEIWSDIACPWCYVGFARFARAMADFEHAAATIVTFRAFELDPEAPADRGISSTEMLSRKYGRTLEEARAMQDQLAAVAAQDGLTVDPAKQRLANTFDGHRLVKLGAEHGVQHQVKERLLRAYHAEGELVSDHAALVRLAAEAGVPAEATQALLASDRLTEEVRAEEAAAVQLGIRGVPFFVVDRAYGASGAQDPAELLKLLEHGWSERAAA